MDILYADNHIVVVNKRAGLATESNEQESLEKEGKIWIKERYNKPGSVFLHAAHRLDKPVSGIVILAKTTKALIRLQEAFRTKQTKKTYLALVEGTLSEPSGDLEDFLVHGDFCAHISTNLNPKAKRASLSYRTLGNSLLEIMLHTGRYHQIRAQFSHRGHPILNDTRYGARRISNSQTIALHHQKITFHHPVSRELLTFTAPLPDNWIEFFQNL